MIIDLEAERLEILKRYRKLLRTAKPYLKDDDAKEIKKAFLMSAEAHKEMRRKSGEPYIYHIGSRSDLRGGNRARYYFDYCCFIT
jgi:guanosine-3',5'-bis(diphosphate) 3'-pyrophosphohydrolase